MIAAGGATGRAEPSRRAVVVWLSRHGKSHRDAPVGRVTQRNGSGQEYWP
jgi:hypothetical protein